jgi:hypothetical protein
MQLGETIATYDVDLALRGESGKFEVTSPAGETYYVISKANHSILQPDMSGSRTYPQAYLIRKIAEPVSLEQASRTTSAVEPETAMPPSPTPFLLENRQPDDQSLANVELLGATPETPRQSSDLWNLDLFYAESDSGMELPVASICVKNAHEDDSSGTRTSLTSQCGNFNDLEAEIRRLHAQLDEICSRAKKKFYKAHAAAASA